MKRLLDMRYKFITIFQMVVKISAFMRILQNAGRINLMDNLLVITEFLPPVNYYVEKGQKVTKVQSNHSAIRV